MRKDSKTRPTGKLSSLKDQIKQIHQEVADNRNHVQKKEHERSRIVKKIVDNKFNFRKSIKERTVEQAGLLTQMEN